MSQPSRILVVDDEQSLREFLEIFLRKQGHEVHMADGGQAAVDLIAAGEEFDLVLTDLKMPSLDGMGVLEAVKDAFPETQVLMMTAYASAETAIEAMKKGAYDYVQKPFNVDEIAVVVAKGLEQRRLRAENRELRAQVRRQSSFHSIIGRSPRMQQVFDLIARVAETRTSVLITGESGTGKSLIARALHSASERKDAPLVTVNCGAIPENLLESELFGHMKGSFTGAVADKLGMFAAADGGTIFLDEIGDVPMHLQVKLLRVLQERLVRPVGSNAERSVNVRVIAATNQDLDASIRAATFREDLYYRLNVIHIEVPALRERRSDIAPIAQTFLKRFSEEMGKNIKDFEPGAMEAILAYDYPGNVRELENVIERAITFETQPLVTRTSLPPALLGVARSLEGTMSRFHLPEEGLDLESTLGDVERRLLTEALALTGGNRTEAARLLQISFRAMRYKLDKYEIGGGDKDEA
jgi:two-component system response regulator PilR (NtrC family)